MRNGGNILIALMIGLSVPIGAKDWTAPEQDDNCPSETVRLQPLRINTAVINQLDSAGRRTGLWVSDERDGTVRTTNYFAGKRNGLDSWYEYLEDSCRYFLSVEAMFYADRLQQITMWRPGMDLRSLVTEIEPTAGSDSVTEQSYRGLLREFDQKGRMTFEGEVMIRDDGLSQPLFTQLPHE